MFQHLNAILYKSKLAIDDINENSEFTPYLVQRWCTMHSPAVTTLVNETTNKYWPVLNDKMSWFITLNTVIPKCKFKKINYIKKSKKELESNEKAQIQKIANNLEISSRELISYIKEYELKLNTSKTND